MSAGQDVASEGDSPEQPSPSPRALTVVIAAPAGTDVPALVAKASELGDLLSLSLGPFYSY